ncbi:hypothetical protein JCM5296_006916 [Sporobolomyces johnsonii]
MAPTPDHPPALLIVPDSTAVFDVNYNARRAWSDARSFGRIFGPRRLSSQPPRSITSAQTAAVPSAGNASSSSSISARSAGTRSSGGEKEGVLFKDGVEIKADMVVMATGYTSQRETVRKIISDDVADRLGNLWGQDAQGEIPGVWRNSGVPRFYLQSGNLFQARCFSPCIAPSGSVLTSPQA